MYRKTKLKYKLCQTTDSSSVTLFNYFSLLKSHTCRWSITVLRPRISLKLPLGQILFLASLKWTILLDMISILIFNASMKCDFSSIW